MRTEKFVAVLFLIALVLKLMNITEGALLLTVALAGLALLYLLGGFYFFCDKSLKRQKLALSIISGIFLSNVPLIILFKLQYWPGAQVMVTMCTLCGILLCIPVAVLTASNSREDLLVYYRNLLFRTITLTGISAILFLTPATALISLQYRNDPEMARLMIALYRHPETEQYKQEFRAYRRKQDSLKRVGQD